MEEAEKKAGEEKGDRIESDRKPWAPPRITPISISHDTQHNIGLGHDGSPSPTTSHS